MYNGENPGWKAVAIVLEKEMEEKLAAIGLEEPAEIVRAFKSLQVCKELLERLKRQVLEFGMENKEDEVHFFKVVKPKFQSRMIYYHKIFLMENGMPPGGRKDQRMYLQKEMDELNGFFEKHQYFYGYYRGGSTYLDEKLFLRYQQMDTATMGYLIDLDADPHFSTAGDFFVAKVLANSLLAEWLEEQLLALEAGAGESGNSGSEAMPELTWTASKADFGEMIYAFHEAKVFNHGHATMKQVADFMCKHFNVKISNIYKLLEEIRMRKNKSRTEFIDKLRDWLRRRMGEDDE